MLFSLAVLMLCVESPKWTRSLGSDSGPVAMLTSGEIIVGSVNKDQEASLYRLGRHGDGVVAVVSARRHADPFQDPREFGVRSPILETPSGVVVFWPNGRLAGYDSEWKQLWTLDLPAKHGVFKRNSKYDFDTPSIVPHLHDGHVFLSTGNGSTHGMQHEFQDRTYVRAPASPSVICVDAATGIVKWTSKVGSKRAVVAGRASPLYVSKSGKSILVFPGPDGVLRGLSVATGEVVWQSGSDSWNWSWTTPVRAGRKIILSVSEPHRAVKEATAIKAFDIDSCLEPEAPRPAWVFRHPRLRGSTIPPVTARGIVFTLSITGELFALDLGTGGLLWMAVTDHDPCSFGEMFIIGRNLFVSVVDGYELYRISRSSVPARLWDIGKTPRYRSIVLPKSMIIVSRSGVAEYVLPDSNKLPLSP